MLQVLRDLQDQQVPLEPEEVPQGPQVYQVQRVQPDWQVQPVLPALLDQQEPTGLLEVLGQQALQVLPE